MQTVDYILARDRHRQKPRTFVLRIVPDRKCEELAQRLGTIGRRMAAVVDLPLEEHEGAAQTNDAEMLDLITPYLVGWRNVDGWGEFLAGKVRSLLSGPEAAELAAAIIEGSRASRVGNWRDCHLTFAAEPPMSIPDRFT